MLSACSSYCRRCRCASFRAYGPPAEDPRASLPGGAADLARLADVSAPRGAANRREPERWRIIATEAAAKAAPDGCL
jgi:hypothetical protein